MRSSDGSILALMGASVVAFAALAAGGAIAADAPKAIGMTSAGGDKGDSAIAPAPPCATHGTASTTSNPPCAARAGVMPYVGGLRNPGASGGGAGVNLTCPSGEIAATNPATGKPQCVSPEVQDKTTTGSNTQHN